MEVKIDIFFYLWAGKDALHGHYLVLMTKHVMNFSITEYLALTPRSQDIFLVSLEAIFLNYDYLFGSSRSSYWSVLAAAFPGVHCRGVATQHSGVYSSNFPKSKLSLKLFQFTFEEGENYNYSGPLSFYFPMGKYFIFVNSKCMWLLTITL